MNVQELRDKLAMYRDCETNINKITVDGTKRLVTLESEPDIVTKPVVSHAQVGAGKKEEVKK